MRAGMLGLLAGPLGRARAAASPASSLRGEESGLLHARLDLRGVRGYRGRRGPWQPFSPGAERLLVVHLWALECPPCVAELPMLRTLVRGWHDQPTVRFLFVAETLDASRLLAFWLDDHHADVPEVELYQSTDGRIRDVLGIGTQPLTLMVDSQGVVRQAFIGSLADRRFELGRAIGRLISALTLHK